MKQSDILLRSGMWKIQNEKNTTKFEKQTLRFEIKKEKISTLEKLPHIETKNNIFEFTSSNWPVYRSRKREKNWKWKGPNVVSKTLLLTFVPSSLLLEDCVHSIVSNNLPSAGSIPLLPTLIRWFPARATEVEVLACRRCSINLSLARHLRDCVRAICYALERGWQRIRIIGLLLMNCVQNIRRCNNYANKYSIIRRRLDNREVSSFFHDDNLLAISREIIIE